LAVLCGLNSLIVIPGFVLYGFLTSHNLSIKNFQTWVGDLMRLLVPVALCILLICIYNYARFGDFLETGYESGFGSGFLTGFLGILFSPGKSIFLYNPLIILGLLAVPQFCRKRRPVFVLFAWIVGVHLLLFSFWHSWYGGMGWGPRLMAVTLPFLILAIGYLLELNARKWMKPFFALLVLGLLIQTASVLVNPARYYYDLRQQFGERSETLLIHSPQHSPLVGQWKQVMVVMRQMGDQQRIEAMVFDAKSGRQFIGKSDKEVLENGLAVNVPNFWWYYMKLFGYPWLLYGFPPMLLTGTFLFCGFYISKIHRHPAGGNKS
jgi:hypothetical protein